MKAVGYTQPGALNRPEALIDFELPEPQSGPTDLLVSVDAVAVNPVDTKIRRTRRPEPGAWQVLGWDAVGTVVSTGHHAVGFSPGDRVFYAGAIDRPGCNSQFHVVDHRIAAHAPVGLSDAQVAALPLTSLTAWELLFDRLGVPVGGGAGHNLLVIGAPGGVGSMLIQFARRLTKLTVIATAGRPESRMWVSGLGAHHVIDHRQPWLPQLHDVGCESVTWQAALTHTAQHWESMVEIAQPQGAIAVIDDPGPLDVAAMKRKSLALHWEFMFTRSLFATEDMAEQGRILGKVADLAANGTVVSPVTQTLSPISAAHLLDAHRQSEAGTTIGKIAVTGW